VSSGDQIRHRLSRAGNRRINHALHMMAGTQIRYPTTPGRRYYERKRTEGKTPKEALRCLKRRLSDLVYYQLIADQRGTIGTCGSPTTPPPTRFYIHLTSAQLTPGRTTTQASTPPGTEGFVALDWKDDRLVGIEILDASTRLHRDLLDEAEILR
jgi:transposase